MHQRNRELTPLLPQLVDVAHARRAAADELLAAATCAAPDEVFTAAGQTLRRAILATDPSPGGTGRPGVIDAVEPDAGGGTTPDVRCVRRNLTLELRRRSGRGPAWRCSDTPACGSVVGWVFAQSVDAQIALDRMRDPSPGVVADLLGALPDGRAFGVLLVASDPGLTRRGSSREPSG